MYNPIHPHCFDARRGLEPVRNSSKYLCELHLKRWNFGKDYAGNVRVVVRFTFMCRDVQPDSHSR
jgi:hypothetical protein